MERIGEKGASGEAALMLVDDEANILSALLRVFDGEGYRIFHYRVCVENQRLTELTLDQNKTLKHWNSKLEEEVKRQTSSIVEKKQELELLYRQLEANFVDTIKTFSVLIDMHDPETCSHSRRVTQASRFMAKQLGIASEALRTVEIAAMLHDVGKIGIPDTILKKPDYALSRVEREILQRHPLLGEKCVQSITSLCDAGTLIRRHHENFGGGGYPDRILGEAIPLGARIIAVADAFDRQLHPQGQAREVNPKDVLKQMRSQAGSLFDPRVINALIPYIEEESKKAATSVEVAIPINNLKVGMALTRDVVTNKELCANRPFYDEGLHISAIKWTRRQPQNRKNAAGGR
ncbi:MAG: HD domain-containing protein [Candidatus Lindowbacteria bacterium]|nr:HD domain-containing protein [Candidatus Lindowbacteria bacterium]